MDLDQVEVDFTYHQNGTDVRVVGLGKDDPDSEFRVVGDTKYSLAKVYGTNADGSLLVTKHWLTADLTSTRWADRYVVQNGRGSTGIGTPLGLIKGIVKEGDVRVVESDEHSTTYQCSISPAAIQRAVGENVRGEGYDGSEPGEETRIVVDSEGLPTRIQSDVYLFEFSGWATTPRVIPPDAPTMDFMDWHMSQHTPRADD